MKPPDICNNIEIYIRNKIITNKTNIPKSFPVLSHTIATPLRRIITIIGNISNFSAQYSDLEIRPEKLTYFLKNEVPFAFSIFIEAFSSISLRILCISEADTEDFKISCTSDALHSIPNSWFTMSATDLELVFVNIAASTSLLYALIRDSLSSDCSITFIFL